MNAIDNKNIELLLANAYTLTDIQKIEPVTHGYLSENWRIQLPNRNVFLKEYRSDLTLEKIEIIHEVLKRSVLSGIPTIEPLTTNTGGTIILWHGRLYSLFPFISGIHHSRPSLTSKHMHALGDMLARIHRQGAGSIPPPALPTFQGFDRQKFFEQAQKILELIAIKEVQTDFDQRAQAGLHFKMACANADPRNVTDFVFTDYTLLHGDFHEHNVFFDEHDHIMAVFDWEKTMYGPRAFELVRSLYLMCLSIENIPQTEAFTRAKIMFDAYQKGYPLAPEEFITAVEFYYVDQYYTDWIERLHYLKNIPKADQLLEESLTRIRLLRDHRKMFIKAMLAS